MSRWTVLTALALVALAGLPWVGQAAPDAFVFWQLRVPRVLMGFLIGATLALAGAVYQCLFENPLATPSTVGTTGGAALGALAATVLGGTTVYFGLPLVVPAAFAGALAVTGLIGVIAYRREARINDVLLAGIAISLASSALAAGLRFSADLASTVQAVRWSLGNLAQVGYDRLLVMVPFAVVSGALVMRRMRALAALAQGEEKAATQGVDVRRLRTLGLTAGSLGVGAAVALAGPIAFVGLIVPHLVRGWFGAARRDLLPASALLGGVFLAACDALCRVALPGREIPVGVATAGIGAPLLVWIIGRRRS